MALVRDVPAPIVDSSGRDPAARSKPLPWRRRHPVVARGLLYGVAASLFAAGALWWMHDREVGRQEGLLTILKGAEDVRAGAPEVTLRIVREQVLAASPNAEVSRSAHLAEAAALDALKRYVESEAAYARLEAGWPASQPRGAFLVPWANMRVSAGNPKGALELLDRPGATEGFGAEEVAAVRARAEKESAAAGVPAGVSPSGRVPGAR